MISISIDDKPLTVAPGTRIIDAADAADIYIPRFCYHKKLSVVANCRMCLVEVVGSRKPLPACATTVTDGMKVYTQSQMALDAQKSVMEFLLINHPLDCPICDQGGECELQDLSMGFGQADSGYSQGKRSVYSENIGPLIETWMTRCIHCTRCVRFGEEIARVRELGATGRGEEMEIGTYVQHFLKSELSGNIIDLCPVGALTNKPARYEGRSWEYREHPMISPHDCVGSHLFIHTRAHQTKKTRIVMRAVPRANDNINETWLSDRDRFSCTSVNSPNRLLDVKMKRDGKWMTVGWERALAEIADRTLAITSQQGAEQLAALAGYSCTTEEYYLLQKVLRQLGSHNIDHRIREYNTQADDLQHGPGLNMAISDIADLQAVLLFGSHIRHEQPLLAHHLNKASDQGAVMMAINAYEYAYTFPVAHQLIAGSQQWLNLLAQVVKSVLPQEEQVQACFADITISPTAKKIANQLKKAKRAAVFVGEMANHHPQVDIINQLLDKLAHHADITIARLSDGCNSQGAWQVGMLPIDCDNNKKVGSTAHQLLTDKPVRGYYLVNLEPELDTAYPAQTLAALKQAGLVVCFTPFDNPQMQDYADFILPITPFTETDGSYVNCESNWQAFSAVAHPQGEAKPLWKVLRVLAHFLQLPEFDYANVEQVRADAKQQQIKFSSTAQPSNNDTLSLPQENTALTRLAPWPIYCVDSLVRHSEPLQATKLNSQAVITLHPNTAKHLGFFEGEMINAIQQESHITAPLQLSIHLAEDSVLLPSGINLTAGFGAVNQAITLTRAGASA